MFELKGIYTPIATPFAEDKSIDYEKLDSNLEYWFSTGLEGLVVLGSNGEFVSLREKEKEEIIRYCCKKAEGRKPIVVGTGGNSITETVHLCEYSAECGAKAVLVVTPFYFKNGMTESILEKYYVEVADYSPLPVILYNMPANTGVNISARLTAKLSRHKNIIGIKDTSGNITQIAEAIKDAEPGFSVLAGSWSFFLPSLYMGAKGGTLALGNIFPNECVRLMKFFEEGEHEKARELARRLIPVNTAITAKYGVGGLKVAMEYMGLYGGEPRSPLRRPDKQSREDIYNILKQSGIIQD